MDRNISKSFSKYVDSDSDPDGEQISSLEIIQNTNRQVKHLEKHFKSKMVQLENRIMNLEIELFTMLKDMVSTIEKEANRNKKVEKQEEQKEEPKKELVE